jgi:hypothetical protein
MHRDSWFTPLADGLKGEIVEDMIAGSRHLERECARHAVPYVDMAPDDFDRQQAVALAALLPDER